MLGFTTISPTEGGSVSPSSGTFDSGETFTHIATPSENYDFTNWSGDATGTTNTVSVTIDYDKNITATFFKRDSNGDGVADDIDICSDTPSGETVDANVHLNSSSLADLNLLWPDTYEFVTALGFGRIKKTVGSLYFLVGNS